MAKRARARKATPGGAHELRRKFALLCIVAGAAVIVGRAFMVTVVQHRAWERRAEAQQGDTVRVPAARGTIYDRDGAPLAASREVYIVAIAPREVEDTALVVKRLRGELGLTSAQARRVFTSPRRWRVLGQFEESTRQALNGIHGFHFEPTMRRFYPHGGLAAELLGNVNQHGEVAGGIEQEMDSVLAGRDGKAVKRVDSHGRAIPGAMLRVAEPEPGRDIVLTVDAELQEIATDALDDALDGTGAEAGEMLIIDPHTGEILAAVSGRRNAKEKAWTAATAPYEPGSTIKPFTVASLLAEGSATLTDSIYAEDGSYRLYGRTINDVHGYGWLTLREGFLVSSNIVMAKVAARMQPGLQYSHLRDFGFGIPTGVSYPSESGGTLRRPTKWSKQSSASLAFGYELSVTPLQLAMAYSVLANGGVLMQPRLVREVRARDGQVYRATSARAVRRVVSADVAAQMRSLLQQVVEAGTGTQASLGSWKVAGKTGTARFAAGGRYIPGAYIATFAGFFPAESPQIVFLVKLDRPRGDYYGGLTAAPVTKATLQAALAARGTPLDRRAVAVTGMEAGSAGGGAGRAGSSTDAIGEDRIVAVATHDREPVVLGLAAATAATARTDADTSAQVPAVKGAPLRDAVRALHAAGFRVRVEGSGTVSSTDPSAGAAARPGSVVVVQAGSVR